MRISNQTELAAWAATIARRLRGGEVIELIGDVGAGKTTFTKALAQALGVQEVVQSPTFTISREYAWGDEKRLVHYDFYRLTEAGIMRDELAETIRDPRAVTVVEWADVTADVLPAQRLTIQFAAVAGDEQARDITLTDTTETA